MLIVATEPLDDNGYLDILNLRCEEEDVEFDRKAIEFLAKIATETSVRYAM